jgi:Holliday junction resolvasome RuvABC endonuclease subunit
MLKILALDLGTKTGVARNFGLPPLETTWELSTATEVTKWGKQRLTRRCDPRIGRLYQRLMAEYGQAWPDLIVFEDVEFSTYTKQTQLWASFRTVVWLASVVMGAATECVPVTTLKKFATGSGAADKVAMRRALFTQFPYVYSVGLDDNAIDALWVLKWAEKNLSRMVFT